MLLHNILANYYYILSDILSPISEIKSSLGPNDLPYNIPIHPNLVHLTIGLFAIAIFIAIIFGQIEAGLANPYGSSRDILNYHSTIGWSLAAILSIITGWRYVSRQNNPNNLSIGFLSVDIMLAFLVCIQVYLGDKLVWIYGLHTVPVVNAIRDGII